MVALRLGPDEFPVEPLQPSARLASCAVLRTISVRYSSRPSKRAVGIAALIAAWSKARHERDTDRR